MSMDNIYDREYKELAGYNIEGPPPEYRNLDEDLFPCPSVYQKYRAMLDSESPGDYCDFDGDNDGKKGLFLFGNSGSGKTRLMWKRFYDSWAYYAGGEEMYQLYLKPCILGSMN